MDFSTSRQFQGLCLIVFLSAFFAFSFLALQSNYVPNKLSLPPIARFPGLLQEASNQAFWSLKSASDSDVIDILVQRQQKKIEEEMASYLYHPNLRHLSNFGDLLPSNGGNPIRNMVVTTWRSGSTFLGDLMQSHPASFYHYEPLLPYGITRIRKGPLSVMALNDLEKLLRCDYSDMDHFLTFAQSHSFLLSHNEEVWKICNSERKRICYMPEYLSKMCKIYPFQNIKTVRLQTNLVEKFLADKSLDLRVLLLVRDPRATIQSRHHRDWCPGEPDCEDSRRLCGDLVSDYKALEKLTKKYPNTFKAVRYEDVSFDIYNMSRELFDFFRLTYHEDVEHFLDTHTKEERGGVSSTYRDSNTAPIHWRSDLTWEEVKSIQKHCAKALKLWGYNFAHNASHVLSFDPVGDLELSFK